MQIPILMEITLRKYFHFMIDDIVTSIVNGHIEYRD